MNSPIDRLSAALESRYAIERELGAGGMATVYLAHDQKHDRKVALKVLKPELAAVVGADRFLAEIRTTANLQHPHILPLFDSGEADGFLYFVMPYVEGESLRDRLDREGELPVDDAVRIATAVAGALDYAHRHGVIHRDIKPANILLHDGQPLVADFGIALAVSVAGGGRLTETGLSLGTPYYMSPEQATAERDPDARSDVFSLGCVLYEMLVGEPPFTGGSAQAVLGKMLTTDPARPTELRRTVPRTVEAAILRALEKLPADRFATAAAFGAALDADAPAQRAVAARPHRIGVRAPVAWAGWGVGALGLAVAAWAVLGGSGHTAPVAEVRHLNIVLPDSAPLAFIGGGPAGIGARALVLSPDGKTLVYSAGGASGDQLYRRDLDDFTAMPIAGTESAFSPFLSPDGQWVGFFVGGELRKVPLNGGAVEPLARIPDVFGAVWGSDGRIYVGARESTTLGWVPQSGGALEEIPNPQGLLGRTPRSFLPDGQHMLVEAWFGGITSVLGVTDIRTGRTVVLTAEGPIAADSVDRSAGIVGAQARYLAAGYLVYSTRAGLVAVAFDPVDLRLSGTPVVMVNGVRRDGFGVQYDVGGDGTLAYAEGGDARVGTLVWQSRDGQTSSLGFPPQQYGPFDLSPDGRRLAAAVATQTGTTELWVYDIERGTHSAVMTRGIPSLPRWWPDGRRVVFTETATKPPYADVAVRQLMESTGERDTLGAGWEVNDFAPDTTRAAGTLGFGHGAWFFPLDPAGPPISLDDFPTAWGPVFSADGRWIAYTSNESGQYEVYVMPATRPGERQKISLAGGEEPLWSPRGDELIYRFGLRWFAEAVPARGREDFGRPRVIFEGPFINVPERSHDIAPDGRRHLVILGPTEQTTGHLNVITNWTAEVITRVGTGAPE